MTGNDIIQDVRPIVKDLTGSIWSPAEIMQKINIARRRIFLDRVEAFWTDENGAVTTMPDDIALTDRTDDLEMEESYRAAVKHHVGYQLLLEKDPKAAAEQLQLYSASIG